MNFNHGNNKSILLSIFLAGLLIFFIYYTESKTFVINTFVHYVYNPVGSIWSISDNLGGTNWREIFTISITYFSFISIIGFVSACIMMFSSNMELWFSKTLDFSSRKWIKKFRNIFALPLYCHFLNYSASYYFKFPARIIAFFLFEPAIILFDIKIATAIFVWVLIHFLTGFYNIYLDYGYVQEDSVSIMNKKYYKYFIVLLLLSMSGVIFSLEAGLLLETKSVVL